MSADTGSPAEQSAESMLFCSASTITAHSPICRCSTSKPALAEPSASVMQPSGFIRVAGQGTGIIGTL